MNVYIKLYVCVAEKCEIMGFCCSFVSKLVFKNNFPCSFEKKIKQKMMEKYKDICVCQAKSINDGLFAPFPY